MILVGSKAFTLTVQVADMPLLAVTVIVHSPGLSAVIFALLSPMEETLAMLDEEDFHVNEVLAFDGWTFAVRVALAPTSKVKSVELRSVQHRVQKYSNLDIRFLNTYSAQL